MEDVTSDGSVLTLDNGEVYSVPSGDASGWEGANVHVSEDESTLTKRDDGEQLEVSHLGATSDSNSYADTGEHTQDTISTSGAILVLEDGSVWSVDSADQATASTWTDAASITVKEGSGTSYELVNTDEHEVVTANYVGSK